MDYFFDFDGTVVDLWERFYHVFCDLNGLQNLSLEDYKRIKREYEKDDLVAKKLGIHISEQYFNKKRDALEQEYYLFFDKPLVNVKLFNSFIKMNNSYLITKRNCVDNLYREIKRLGFEVELDKIIVLESNNISKNEWFEKKYYGEKAILVGDGKEEYNTRFNGKVDLYMVNTGLLNLDTIVDCSCFKKIEKLDHFIIERM